MRGEIFDLNDGEDGGEDGEEDGEECRAIELLAEWV